MKTKLFLAGLIILMAYSCQRKTSDDYKYYKPTPKDTICNEITDTIASVTTENISTTTPEKKEIKGVDLENDSYFIVVASYAVEEFANAQKAELIAQGYKPDIFMIDDDGWFKLAVESYKTYSEATEALNLLKQKQELFSSARIVVKKSK